MPAHFHSMSSTLAYINKHFMSIPPKYRRVTCTYIRPYFFCQFSLPMSVHMLVARLSWLRNIPEHEHIRHQILLHNLFVSQNNVPVQDFVLKYNLDDGSVVLSLVPLN